MRSKRGFSRREMGLFYLMCFFLLGRNSSFIFLDGAVERIYAICSQILSAGIVAVFIIRRRYRYHWKRDFIRHLQKDAVVYVCLLFFILRAIRELFTPQINFHDLIAEAYPVLATVCLIAMASESRPRLFMVTYAGYGFAALCINLVDGLMFRDLSKLYSTAYFFIGPRNQLTLFTGVMTAMVCSVSELYPKKFRWLRPATAVVMIANAIMMKSATTAICTFLLCVILLMPSLKKWFQKEYSYIIVLGGYAAAWLSVVVFRIQNLFSGLIWILFRRNATLTSRTRIWDVALQEVNKHVFFGHGASSTGDLFTIDAWRDGVYQEVSFSAHNQVLQNMYEGGIFLILGYIAIYAVSFRNRKKAHYFMSCLLVTLVACLVEAPGLYSFLFLCFMGFYSNRFFAKPSGSKGARAR